MWVRHSLDLLTYVTDPNYTPSLTAISQEGQQIQIHQSFPLKNYVQSLKKH